MCYNPIPIRLATHVQNYISNDGELLYHHFGHRIDVRCGHCEQCLQAKRDGYVLRTEAEFNRCTHAFFLTLTYSNRHLPYVYQYSTPVFDDDGYCVAPPKRYKRSVWNKSHVQTFLKALNERIIYYYGTQILGLKRQVTNSEGTNTRYITPEWKEFVSNFPRPLKYLCVCERGKNNIYTDYQGKKRTGSRRPHYHLILFLNCDIETSVINDFIIDMWHYGLVYNANITSPESPKDVRDVAKSIRYICKYVTKDISDISSYLLYSNHESYLLHAPFVLISNGYGDNLLDKYSDADLLYHLVNGITISGTDTSPERVVPVPLYNVRKSKCYVSHDLGNFVSSRYQKTEVFFDLSPVFLDGELEYSIYHRVKYYITDFGIKVSRLKRQKYVSDSFTLFLNIRKNPNILKSYIGNFSNLPFYSDLFSVDISDFRDYLFNPYHVDSGDISSPYYRAYICFQNILVNKSKYERLKRLIDYKLKLEQSLVNKPELLCLQPLQHSSSSS